MVIFHSCVSLPEGNFPKDFKASILNRTSDGFKADERSINFRDFQVSLSHGHDASGGQHWNANVLGVWIGVLMSLVLTYTSCGFQGAVE